MRKVANRSAKDLEALFKETSAKDGRFNEAIVEKDFWVCVMLDHLFRHCRYGDAFTFKGGTSRKFRSPRHRKSFRSLSCLSRCFFASMAIAMLVPH